MKGKILVQSSNIDTYVNIIAAMYAAYQDLKEVRLSFINSAVKDDLIDAIQNKLSLSNNQIYTKAARLHFSGESIDFNDTKHSQGWDVIDVSAVSKEIALNVVAATIDNRKVNVCTLQWSVSFGAQEQWILTNNNHYYSNLLSKGALLKLYKNYFQKKQVAYIGAVIILILVILSIIKYLVPTFVVPADVVNVLSLLIGAAGLYIAIITLKT